MSTAAVRIPLATTAGLVVAMLSVFVAHGNPPFATHDLPGPVANTTAVPSVMKLDSQGRPVFVFFRDSTSQPNFGSLEIYRCNDAVCSTGVSNVVYQFVPRNSAIGMAIDARDVPLVAFGPAGSLNLVDCKDPVCSAPAVPKSFSSQPVASDRGIIDVEIRPSGDGAVISQQPTRVTYYWCGDVGCPSGLSGNFFDNADRTLTSGSDFSLTHTAGGFPVASMKSDGLVAAFCPNLICSGKNDVIRDLDTSDPGVGAQSHISLNPSTGLPVVAYLDEDRQVRLAICTDVNCATAPIIRQVTTTGAYSWPSVAYRGDTPYGVAASDAPQGGILRFECSNALCDDISTGFADGSAEMLPGSAPSIAVAADFALSIGFWEPVTQVVRLLTLEPPMNPGDIDCDGLFEPEDALIILRSLAGFTTNASPSGICDLDVNDDSVVDMRDLHWMRLAIAGLLS